LNQVLEVSALAYGYSDLAKNFTVQLNPSLTQALTMALSHKTIVSLRNQIQDYIRGLIFLKQFYFELRSNLVSS